MKLTTTTQVSVDGVMQGCGGPDEDRRGEFERGGWAMGLFDNEVMTFVNQVYQRAEVYGFEVKDPEALGALYDRVLAAFPDAYLEDPHDLPEAARRLGDHVERVSYDAPIHTAEDIDATPLPARVVNVKPSRIGSLRALFEVYARCARERRPM